MTKRTLLRSQLITAWRKTIADSYCEQLINSESGLQVYFCLALLNVFSESGVKRRLFIEPRISVPNSLDRLYPDVVICNTKQVIGVVELKYSPRARPGYKKDLNTLKFVANHPDKITITNDRFLGPTTQTRNYPLAPDAVLCWAGIYSGELLNIYMQSEFGFDERFLRLDVLTNKNNEPLVLIGGK